MSERRPHLADGERGTVLMLMPAAVLIVVILAAITVDLSLVHLGEREAHAAASAAANDAVTYGLDPEALYAGTTHLDPERVTTAVHAALAGQELTGHLATPPTIAITGDQVTVTVTLRIDYIFGAALPGPDTTIVQSQATATLVPA